MDIDLVYLWVDGSDPAWIARKRAACGIEEAAEGTSETNCKARWTDNDELKYSLRSAERFAPWIRRVFIVTDGQTPGWLDTSNPRVRVVDHTEIMPSEARPCFNASVIEHYLYRIPELGERFLFANDDMFFSAPVGPEFFFTDDSLPYVRLQRKRLGKLRLVIKRAFGIGFGHYRRMLFNSAHSVESLTGKYYSGIPHHNIDAYTREDYRHAVEEVFRDEIAASATHHVRTEGDFHRSAIGLWTLATGRAHLKYIEGRRECMRIGVHRPPFIEKLRRYSPSLFCLNDSQRVTDDNRALIRPFLETLFPEPSAFEKPGE